MLDQPSVDEHDDYYFYDLVLVAPDEDEVMKIMMEGLWYQMLLASNTTRLSDEEKALLIYKGHVDWDKLLTDCH